MRANARIHQKKKSNRCVASHFEAPNGQKELMSQKILFRTGENEHNVCTLAIAGLASNLRALAAYRTFDNTCNKCHGVHNTL
jgi:hypothetical protein